MSPHRSLILASFAFAVMWTAGMYWWNGPMPLASAVILMVAGAIAGLGWYFGMRLWMKWSGRLS